MTLPHFLFWFVYWCFALAALGMVVLALCCAIDADRKNPWRPKR